MPLQQKTGITLVSIPVFLRPTGFTRRSNADRASSTARKSNNAKRILLVPCQGADDAAEQVILDLLLQRQRVEGH